MQGCGYWGCWGWRWRNELSLVGYGIPHNSQAWIVITLQTND
jgi:hypothetical protein